MFYITVYFSENIKNSKVSYKECFAEITNDIVQKDTILFKTSASIMENILKRLSLRSDVEVIPYYNQYINFIRANKEKSTFIATSQEVEEFLK